MIFRVLGIPDEDVIRVKAGAESRMLLMWGRPKEDAQVRFAEGMAAFWRYAETLVASRAEHPRDDFTSDLLLARDGDSPALSHREVASIVYELLFAGHETVTGLLGNTMHQLLVDRDAWEEICRDPALIPNAVEEVLRFDSSAITWRRKTTQAVEIGGVPVPAEATVLVLLGSANRDVAVFENPDRFDIHRKNAKEHLSFGNGARLLPGGAAGSPRGTCCARGTERAPSQPASGAGAGVAVPAQYHVPWTALALGRVGCLKPNNARRLGSTIRSPCRRSGRLSCSLHAVATDRFACRTCRPDVERSNQALQ